MSPSVHAITDIISCMNCLRRSLHNVSECTCNHRYNLMYELSQEEST